MSVPDSDMRLLSVGWCPVLCAVVCACRASCQGLSTGCRGEDKPLTTGCAKGAKKVVDYFPFRFSSALSILSDVCLVLMN